MNISKLKFFDRTGKPYQFTFDEENQVWKGFIILPPTSVGLYASNHLYIIEQITPKQWSKPYAFGKSFFQCSWDMSNDYVDEIFLFKFNEDEIIHETSALIYTPQDGPDITSVCRNVGDVVYYELEDYAERLRNSEESQEDLLLSQMPVQINIGFSATPGHDATTYKRTLFIQHKTQTTITPVAEITIFAESVDADERLSVTCNNLGYKILDSESAIFKNTSLNEPYPDYIFLNEKRKEILMEGHNIYPFVGSYKALFNAIKFFGYNNVGIVEYYRNMNIASEYAGKIIRQNKYSVSNDFDISNQSGVPRKISLPSRDYKKMNVISLVYKINEVTDFYDEFELPRTQESFDYTLEEAMIKLYSLRRKLDAEFMPGSSRIRDIIGEASYFGLQTLSNSAHYEKYDYITSGIPVKFEASTDNPFITYDFVFEKFLKENYGVLIDDCTEAELATYFEIFTKSNIDSVSSDVTMSEVEAADNKNISAKVILYNKTFDPVTIDDTYKLTIEEYTDNILISTFDVRNYDRIEWIVKYDGVQNGPQFEKTVEGNVLEYEKVLFMLPYTGKYTVSCKLTDTTNNFSFKSLHGFIDVKPLQVEVSGFYYDARPLPSMYSYSKADKDTILSIVRDIKEKLKDSKYYDSYYWDNLETLKFNNTQHLTYDVTNHNDIRSDSVLPSDDAEFETLRYIRDGVVVKPYTWFVTGIDFSKIAGIKKISWTLSDGLGNTVLSESSEYFMYMLKNETSYSLTCTVLDLNNNIHTITRNLFNVKRSADYEAYQSFSRDLAYLQKMW